MNNKYYNHTRKFVFFFCFILNKKLDLEIIPQLILQYKFEYSG